MQSSILQYSIVSNDLVSIPFDYIYQAYWDVFKKFLKPNNSILEIEIRISSDIQNQEYKIALPSYFTDQGKEAKYWEFQVTGPDPDVMTRSYVHKKCPQEKMVFHRFDSFLNRLNTMVEFFNTAVQVDEKQTNQFTFI